MIQFLTFMLTARRDEEKGATAVEYGLLVALIAAVIVVTVGLLGDAILGAFNTVLADLISRSKPASRLATPASTSSNNAEGTMNRTSNTCRDDGATAVEYALLVALIAAVVIGAVAIRRRGIHPVSSDTTPDCDGYPIQHRRMTPPPPL